VLTAVDVDAADGGRTSVENVERANCREDGSTSVFCAAAGLVARGGRIDDVPTRLSDMKGEFQQTESAIVYRCCTGSSTR
jgi:hypothetical protein